LGELGQRSGAENVRYALMDSQGLQTLAQIPLAVWAPQLEMQMRLLQSTGRAHAADAFSRTHAFADIQALGDRFQMGITGDKAAAVANPNLPAPKTVKGVPGGFSLPLGDLRNPLEPLLGGLRIGKVRPHHLAIGHSHHRCPGSDWNPADTIGKVKALMGTTPVIARGAGQMGLK
jgi:hypothetical protein